MRIDKQYWWETLNLNILGSEGEGGGDGGSGAGDGGAGNSAAGGNSGGADNDDQGGSDNGGNDGNSNGGQGGEDVSGLKSALEKERADRKALEKQIKAYQKTEKDKEDAEKSEVQRLTDQSAKDQEKLGKLAAKARINAVDAAIKRAAEKFIDPSDVADALRNHPDIKVEQDEDDPSDVTVDAKSVQKLVDDLAKKKTHWLKGQGPSGSKFGGQGGSNDDKALISAYPALAARLGNT